MVPPKKRHRRKFFGQKMGIKGFPKDFVVITFDTFPLLKQHQKYQWVLAQLVRYSIINFKKHWRKIYFSRRKTVNIPNVIATLSTTVLKMIFLKNIAWSSYAWLKISENFHKEWVIFLFGVSLDPNFLYLVIKSKCKAWSYFDNLKRI